MPRDTLRVLISDPDKYRRHIEEERNKKAFWDSLVQKLEGMHLTGSEKEVIKQEVLQRESDLIRKM